MSVDNLFASRLRQAMTLRRIKQIELCEMTGIPKSAISQYLRGSFEPKQDRLWTLAKALGVSEAWLMGYEVGMDRTVDNGPVTVTGDFMGSFPIRLKELREESGYSSQQAFANAFGVAQSTVGGWESGSRTPTLEVTKQLAQFFKVSTDYLCGNIEDAPEKEKAPLFSSEALRLARDYDELDEHGQKIVRMVTDEEKNRIDTARPAAKKITLAVAPEPEEEPDYQNISFAAYGDTKKKLSKEDRDDISAARKAKKELDQKKKSGDSVK